MIEAKAATATAAIGVIAATAAAGTKYREAVAQHSPGSRGAPWGMSPPRPTNPEGVVQMDQCGDHARVEPRWGSETLMRTVTQGGAALPPLTLGCVVERLRRTDDPTPRGSDNGAQGRRRRTLGPSEYPHLREPQRGCPTPSGSAARPRTSACNALSVGTIGVGLHSQGALRDPGLCCRTPVQSSVRRTS